MTLADGTPVSVLPLEYDRTDGWVWFEISRGVSFEPLEADGLIALREHYNAGAGRGVMRWKIFSISFMAYGFRSGESVR